MSNKSSSQDAELKKSLKYAVACLYTTDEDSFLKIDFADANLCQKALLIFKKLFPNSTLSYTPDTTNEALAISDYIGFTIQDSKTLEEFTTRFGGAVYGGRCHEANCRNQSKDKKLPPFNNPEEMDDDLYSKYRDWLQSPEGIKNAPITSRVMNVLDNVGEDIGRAKEDWRERSYELWLRRN